MTNIKRDINLYIQILLGKILTIFTLVPIVIFFNILMQYGNLIIWLLIGIISLLLISYISFLIRKNGDDFINE